MSNSGEAFDFPSERVVGGAGVDVLDRHELPAGKHTLVDSACTACAQECLTAIVDCLLNLCFGESVEAGPCASVFLCCIAACKLRTSICIISHVPNL